MLKVNGADWTAALKAHWALMKEADAVLHCAGCTADVYIPDMYASQPVNPQTEG